jgi:cellulose synthase/poly-beta-1,6-N-acetylglucosamine synthase-like glycosyltransferase
MSKIKVIIPAYNEEKLLHTLLKKFQIQLVKLLFLTTQLIILLKWQQQLPPYFRKQERVWLCLQKEWSTSNQEIKPDIVVFLDGDYSDYPDELTQLIAPILENNIDFVVGSRVARLEKNSMTPQQIFELASNNFNENLL